MKRSALFLASSLLTAALFTAGTGRVAAAEPPSPDLTGNWLGSYISASDPRSVGEAAMRVDSQDRNRFAGKLAMGRLAFDIQGIVTTTPPEPDNRFVIVGLDPPQPGMPGAMILIRGTVRFADPPSPDADPPGEIVADYMIVYADGSMDMGRLELVRIGTR